MSTPRRVDVAPAEAMADTHGPQPFDPYRTLQLHPSAPRDLIEKAYWLLASAARSSHAGAGSRIDALNAAYATLVDDDARRAYDREHGIDRRAAPAARPRGSFLRLFPAKKPGAGYDDYYHVLRIDSQADDRMIQLAHNFWMHQFQNVRTERERVEEACRVLSNPQQRAQYDARRQAQPPPEKEKITKQVHEQIQIAEHNENPDAPVVPIPPAAAPPATASRAPSAPAPPAAPAPHTPAERRVEALARVAAPHRSAAPATPIAAPIQQDQHPRGPTAVTPEVDAAPVLGWLHKHTVTAGAQGSDDPAAHADAAVSAAPALTDERQPVAVPDVPEVRDVDEAEAGRPAAPGQGATTDTSPRQPETADARLAGPAADPRTRQTQPPGPRLLNGRQLAEAQRNRLFQLREPAPASAEPDPPSSTAPEG